MAKELNFKEHMDKLSQFIKQFTGTEKGTLRPFVSQFKPLYENGAVVKKEDGTDKTTPITFTTKDKNGKPVKQYVAEVSFFKKDELNENKSTKVVVKVFSKYLINKEDIENIKTVLVKEGLERFKDATIKRLMEEEYAKDGKSTTTLTFSVNYRQFGFTKEQSNSTKPEKQTTQEFAFDFDEE